MFRCCSSPGSCEGWMGRQGGSACLWTKRETWGWATSFSFFHLNFNLLAKRRSWVHQAKQWSLRFALKLELILFALGRRLPALAPTVLFSGGFARPVWGACVGWTEGFPRPIRSDLLPSSPTPGPPLRREPRDVRPGLGKRDGCAQRHRGRGGNRPAVALLMGRAIWRSGSCTLLSGPR